MITNIEETKIIAIDPDTEKSGVCDVNRLKRSICVQSLPFSALMKHFFYCAGEDVRVIVEAGWKNEKSNFHYFGKSIGIASKVGKSVGRNNQTARHIAEIARDYFRFEVLEIAPLRKCWKGTDGKITQEELNSLIEKSGYSCNKARMNQDERDATLIALYYSNLIK